MDQVRIDRYYLDVAQVIAHRSSCLRRQVGAVIVAPDDRIVATGYNGTPRGVKNCDAGGCPRCAMNHETLAVGERLDECLCVHAEINAIVTAARHGVTTLSGTLYTTLEPCLDCAKAIANAGIARVVYLHIYINDRHDATSLLDRIGIDETWFAAGLGGSRA